MGLPDKMAKLGEKVISDVSSKESKEKAREFFSSVGEKISEAAKDVKEEKPQSEHTCSKQDCECSCSRKKKLLKVLSGEFPRYTVKEDVSPTTAVQANS